MKLAQTVEQLCDERDRLRGLLREIQPVLLAVQELILGLDKIGIPCSGPASISDLLRRIEEEVADGK